NNMSSIDSPDEYLKKIVGFYSEVKDLNPWTIRSRLGISVTELAHIYNNSIFQNGTYYVDKFRHDSGMLSLYMMLVAIAFGVFDFFALTLWQQAAKNQVHRIKLLF